MSSLGNKNNKVAVTGINGFVGKHLARELRSNGIGVVGIAHNTTVSTELDGVVDEYYSADLTAEWPAISGVDAVVHLAGLAAVGPSFDDPQAYIERNSAMVTHMAEHYLDRDQKPRLVVVSSGAIYDPEHTMPLTEEAATSLTSPYVVSKVLVENQCSYYRNRGLDCIVVRPFNHIGPGQLGGFLVPDVVRQLREGSSLTVGNISTKRDYTDVRDIARAYRLLATIPKLDHAIYNACSGSSTSGENIINILRELMGKQDAEVTVDQSKVRPTDPAEQSLRDILAD